MLSIIILVWIIFDLNIKVNIKTDTDTLHCSVRSSLEDFSKISEYFDKIFTKLWVDNISALQVSESIKWYYLDMITG